MTDDGISVENSEQDKLDHLLSQGSPLPVNGNGYSTLYRHLGTYEARLHSNFPDQVMQRILEVKIERARSGAIFQSALIGLLSFIAGVGLMIFSTHYLGAQDLFRIPAQSIQAFVLPGCGALVLLMLLMLDGFLASTPLSAKR